MVTKTGDERRASKPIGRTKIFRRIRNSKLIWCPDNGRQRVADFIDDAKHSLWVQNERYQDTVIIERLVRAATRGVKVHVLTKKPHSLKPGKLVEGIGGLRILQDVGVKVHTLKHLKLHAKMMLADKNAPSSARSISRRAASIRGANSRSKRIITTR